jgi:hypothetical protein
MNTIEARRRLGELTARAIEIVQYLADGDPVSASNSIEIRDILREAREVAYDAGYPGDAAWRALLRTNVYITAPPTTVDGQFWADTIQDLREALQNLLGIEETADAP